MAHRRTKRSAEVVVFFKTHLRGGVDRADYEALDERMLSLVSAIPGFLSIKEYMSEDRERLNIVRFRS